MSRLKYKEPEAEPMPLEAIAEVEILQELERLFRELESEDVNEDRKEEISREIRGAAERYHKLFHGKADADEMIKGIYGRLEAALEKKD